eukprot:Seg4296.2 transcript_id=Seg4296.2/GoldUCD/mRNA.D3Y31 product="putative nuclease HARBI1" protein_id=Seg4296.2/GoldUCD/D3Y31
MAAVNIRYMLLLRWRLIYAYYRRRIRSIKLNQKRRIFWVREVYRDRDEKGEFSMLVQELCLHDHEYFFQCFRMLPTKFEELLSFIAPDITKRSTTMREPISADQRLIITLRYLTTGDACTTIGASYRVSPTTVGRIIQETCQAIWNRLLDNGFMTAPTTEEGWKKIADDFENRWNFPHAVGAIDGKHVVMYAPARAASAYYNYKGTHSIVLMGVCDAKYRFTMVDIGDTGRQSDGSVYNNGNVGYAIENNLLGIPKDSKFRNSHRILPYVFVADDAFGLKRHMMKPYPATNLGTEKLIFNYRLSRARRIIENTFGIAANRFRVFHRPILANVDKVKDTTKAIVILHNYLINTNNSDAGHSYCPENFIDREGPNGILPGEWRQDQQQITGLQPINRIASNNYSESAKIVRDDFKGYFNEEGAVCWQWDRVTRNK